MYTFSSVSDDDWDDIPAAAPLITAPHHGTATSVQAPIKNTTLLSLKSCVNNMKRTMDQMRQYVTQAEGYIEELQASQKSGGSHGSGGSSNRKQARLEDKVMEEG